MNKLLFILFFLVAGGFGALFFLSSGTTIEPVQAVHYVGMDTPVTVKVANAHGIRHLTAWVEQNGKQYNVYETSQPTTRVFFWRKHEQPKTFTFSAGRKKAQGLQEGKATIVVEAKGNDWRAKKATLRQEVLVNTRPLMLSADGAQHYINQGGCELVTFTVSGYWTEAGVRVGNYTFRSFPMPGRPVAADGKAERFSLFAFPWDTPADAVPVVYAKNPTGQQAVAHFWYKIFPKKFRSRDLPIDDLFLDKVVNQIDPGGSGDLLARFLKINTEMRHANNQTLADLRYKTSERFLWDGPFVQLGNSKVESMFADTRSYIYKGKKVDQQTHLGFDLSVTQHVAVVASNDGKVAYADPLGIYGNCVVVDHGYGLQSIYGHLSEIDVKVGDMVKKGQTLGKSGATGLAGGDHLHYSMQVDGTQVNAVEWWDDHWIHDRIRSKIAPSL